MGMTGGRGSSDQFCICCKRQRKSKPLLAIVPVENGEGTDLWYQKITYPKNWGAWQGLRGTSLEQQAAALRRTGYNANSTRYMKSWRRLRWNI